MKTTAIYLNLATLISIIILTSSCMMMHHMPMDNNMNGDKSQHEHGNSEMKMAKDLVCGMQVDTNVALAIVYEGVSYYFDSEECLNVFQKNPQQFVKKEMKMNEESNKGSMSKSALWGGVVMGTMMIVMMAILIAN